MRGEDEVGGAGRGGGEVEGVGAVGDGGGEAGVGVDLGAGQAAVGEVDVDGEVASGAESADASGGPRCGEGGEEVDASGMALEEHFGYAGRASEVAVDLEWGVLVPEVVGGAVFE